MNFMPFMLRCCALLLAGLAAAAPAQPVPDGKLAIHYNRCDGKYEGWGLHVWRSPSSPLPGVSWGNPMPPSGTNEFGPFWQADLSEFNNSPVNYIIHKGDNKEQGGKDMKFDPKASREIWVNSGDAAIYASIEEAQKARAAKPCP